MNFISKIIKRSEIWIFRIFPPTIQNFPRSPNQIVNCQNCHKIIVKLVCKRQNSKTNKEKGSIFNSFPKFLHFFQKYSVVYEFSKFARKQNFSWKKSREIAAFKINLLSFDRKIFNCFASKIIWVITYLNNDRASSSSSKWMSATSGTIFSFDFLAILDFLEPNIAAGKGSEALRFMVYQPQFCNVFEFFFWT